MTSKLELSVLTHKCGSIAPGIGSVLDFPMANELIEPKRTTGNFAPHPNDYDQLVHARAYSKQFVVVNWCLGNQCNYTCSYCPEDLHIGSKTWPLLEKATSFVDKVIDHYPRGQRFFYELTGGEVTLYKDLIPFCNYLSEKGIDVGIISNGSRSFQYWEKISPHIKQICLSFHPESANPDHFYKVVEYFSERVRIHVNVMMSPKHFPLCTELAQRLTDIQNISIALQPLMENLNGQIFDYTSSQMKLINSQSELFMRSVKITNRRPEYRGEMICVKNGERSYIVSPHKMISTQTNTWMGWDCSIGIENLVVDFDGNVMRGWCKVGGLLGNISDSDLKLPTRPIRCDKSYCHCNSDIMATKVKPLEELSN